MKTIAAPVSRSADLNSDPFNCGACGKVCAASEPCTAGSCGACEATVCGSTCVELRTSHDNCGACGNAFAADQCCNAGSCSSTRMNGAACH
jgi:hypothetical protein